jgi:Lhr-like helicase
MTNKLRDEAERIARDCSWNHQEFPVGHPRNKDFMEADVQKIVTALLAFKGKERKVERLEIEYYSHSLSNIILSWSKNFMDRKDWDIEAVDQVKDRVVFKRYQRKEPLGFSEEN